MQCYILRPTFIQKFESHMTTTTKGNSWNFMYTGKLACRNTSLLTGNNPINKITNVINCIGPAKNIPTKYLRFLITVIDLK